MTPILILAAYPAALLIAAANDLYEFKIPNWISVTLLAVYVLGGAALGASLAMIIEGLLVGAAALTIGFILFATKIFGAGDAKLLASISPWIGAAGIMTFLVNVAFAGAVLAMVLILFRRTPPLPIYAHAPWIMRLHSRPKDIPYAVAIAAGGLLSFSQTPYYQLAYGG